MMYLCLGCDSDVKDESLPFIYPAELILFSRTDSGPTLVYEDSESVVSFYSKQNCVIKYSFQRYNVMSHISGVNIPLSLIGCTCGNDVRDLMYLEKINVRFANRTIEIFNDTLASGNELSQKIYSFFEDKDYSVSDYLFDLQVEDTAKMKDVITIIKCMYFGYLMYVNNTCFVDGNYFSLSDKEKKKLIRRYRFMLRLTPSSKVDYKYCHDCDC